jgi:hypothetical protein
MAFVRLRAVSVEFPIYSGGSRSLKKLLLSTTTQGNVARDARDRVSVQALTDIDLDVGHGDRLALIGVNGAGKSTLLKVLAGIYEPTSGRIQAEGQVSALLSAHVGLNMEATGRENIVMRGMYLDIHPRAMRDHVDEIADFTELGYYIDMPVRTYSAGMIIRLCFAVATRVSARDPVDGRVDPRRRFGLPAKGAEADGGVCRRDEHPRPRFARDAASRGMVQPRGPPRRRPHRRVGHGRRDGRAPPGRGSAERLVGQ